MAKIEVNNVYKIFGTDPIDVLPKVKEGATKEEILEQTGHTVGLDNVSSMLKREKLLFVWVYLAQENQL